MLNSPFFFLAPASCPCRILPPCSIDELRVPDHSHLNIPPEMQAAASGGGASSGRSSSQPSTDVSAVGSSDSSGCSTPRASSSRGTDGKPPQCGTSKAQNIAAVRGNSTSNQRPGSRGSRGSTNASSPTQWASFAGTPAASTLLGDASSSPGGYYNAAGMAAAAALEQQRAVLQLQHCQMQAQGLFEQQMHQNLLAAQAGAAAQAQQQQAHQQLMLLQRSQQAAAYLARNSTGGIRGGSPPLSPMPSSSLFERPASFGADTRNYFVPPSSANAGTLAMASAQAQANWQSAALLRSLSTPAHTGSGSLGSDLLRQSSGFSGMGVPASPAHNFASSNGAGVQQLHNSGGSLIDGQADLTLGALLSAASQGLSRSDSQTWGAGTGLSMSAGMPTSAGLPLGCGLQGSGMGDLFSGGTGAGMDATASLLLLQQQMQQNKAAAMGNLLPAFNNGGEVGSEQVLRMMMQQLALQQQSAVM